PSASRWTVYGSSISNQRRWSRVAPRPKQTSEHAVLVQRLFRVRDRLYGVPVFEHLAVIVEPEQVEDCIAALAGLTHRVDMHDDVIAVGEYPFDLALVIRKLVAQEIDKALDAFEPVGADGVMLDIGRADIGRGLVVVFFVEDRVVELDYILL